jgi:hypothetical protein
MRPDEGQKRFVASSIISVDGLIPTPHYRNTLANETTYTPGEH